MRICSKQVIQKVQVLNSVMVPAVGNVSDHVSIICIYSTVDS